MSACVVVFPGQGSQRAGMARDFDRASAAARAVFDEASEALRLDLRRLCFAPDARLRLTEFLQPALLTAEVAMLRALVADHGLRATHFGGHSLGEYAALVAAGAVPLAQAVRLVRERGRLMQTVARPGEGAMTAVIGQALDVGAVERCIAGLQVDVASVNAPGQVVVSGRADDVAAACERLRGLPGHARLRLRPLAVSVPFHCRLLAPVEPAFRALLEDASRGWACERAARVASNYTGALHAGRREPLQDALARQLCSRVRWLDNARALVALGPDRVLEVGPSGALRQAFMTARIPVRTVSCVGDARALGREPA